MAKEYLLIHAGQDDFPVLTEIMDYQSSVLDENKDQKQIEIDLMGKNGKDILFIGECKFKNSPFDKAEFDKLMEKIKYVPASNPKVCVFSLSGFSDYVRKNARDCKLITLDDMYG